MINNVTTIKMGSYVMLVNLIKHISRDVFRDVPYYSDPSPCFEDSLPDMALKT